MPPIPEEFKVGDLVRYYRRGSGRFGMGGSTMVMTISNITDKGSLTLRREDGGDVSVSIKRTKYGNGYRGIERLDDFELARRKLMPEWARLSAVGPERGFRQTGGEVSKVYVVKARDLSAEEIDTLIADLTIAKRLLVEHQAIDALESADSEARRVRPPSTPTDLEETCDEED